jgi:ribosomal protein S18 acetylase RimI-like enzyme
VPTYATPTVQFAPIDLERHFELCVRFLCDTFVESYGSSEKFEKMGGASTYFAGLEAALSRFPEGHVHVWQNGVIVGQLEMRLRPVDDAFVNLFYVAPKQRGHGLGGALHAYVVEVLDQHRVETARLSVAPGNLRALRFYEKHGWHDLGPRPDRPDVHAMKLVRPSARGA